MVSLTGLTLLTALASAQEPTVVGVTRLADESVKTAVGLPGDEPTLWAREARQRLLDLYRRDGYTAARVWVRDEAEGPVVEVDEGRVHRVVLEGANTYERLILSDNLDLPSGLLHLPSLEASLERIASNQPNIRSLTWELIDGDAWVPTVRGMGRERVLKVTVRVVETRGLGLDLGVEAPWGFMAGVTWDRPALFTDDDRFRLGATIAFPIREYIFEEEPKLRWVNGSIFAEHRFGRIGRTALAPKLRLEVRLPNYPRRDLGLIESGTLEGQLQASVEVWRSGPWRQTVGLVVEGGRLIYATFEPETSLDEEVGVIRAGAFAQAELTFDDGTLRTDLRDHLTVFVLGAATLRGTSPHLRARVEGQWVFGEPRVLGVLRMRGVHMGGDIRYFDEVPLAGPYQRVFFRNAYWVRTAAQLEAELRASLTPDVQLGVYHDLSVFGLPRDGQIRAVLANAVGPALHLTLIDQFSIDVYYGFGLAPSGASHNMMFGLQTIY